MGFFKNRFYDVFTEMGGLGLGRIFVMDESWDL